MRKILILTGFCLSCLLTFPQTKNKEKADDIFLQIPYSDYIGEEVSNLLLNDDIRLYQDFRLIDGCRPCVLVGARVIINKNIHLKIYVSKFKYLVPFNENCQWDKQLFYKETISRIQVYQNNVCVIDVKNNPNEKVPVIEKLNQ
jgi:hypothetical protein